VFVTSGPVGQIGGDGTPPPHVARDDRAARGYAAPAARQVGARAPDRRALGVSIDDRLLLAQMRAGEGNAFAMLFERYYDALCAFAAGYTASHAEAEEIVEDLFVRLWELREQLEIRGSLKSYLYMATRNRALNHAREARTEIQRIEDARFDAAAPAMGQPALALDEELHLADFARAVVSAVDGLPARTRQVFLLHRQHGLTYAEIAAALEISPKTVENLLGRALKHLRARLAHFLGD
jgi:RNA polymerase sigma-70 factor (ECF subfamily)